MQTTQPLLMKICGYKWHISDNIYMVTEKNYVNNLFLNFNSHYMFLVKSSNILFGKMFFLCPPPRWKDKHKCTKTDL